MPRFHFHLQDGQDRSDPDGIELPDLDACQAEATGLISQRLKDYGPRLWETKDWCLSVADAEGLVLFSMYVMVVDGALVAPANSGPRN